MIAMIGARVSPWQVQDRYDFPHLPHREKLAVNPVRRLLSSPLRTVVGSSNLELQIKS
jgi:hypothetical protein